MTPDSAADVENSALLLLIAAVVAIVARRLRMPWPVGLVIAGILIAFLPFPPEISLTKNLLFTVLLPPLIFEAAVNMNWRHLRKDLSVVLLLATLGVVFSAAVTACGMHFLAGWEWLSAVIFGVIIAATDPVSVIATFKDAEVRGRLFMLVESESLFNDGTAAVLFAICLELMQGSLPGAGAVTFRLLSTVGGSILCGAIVGGAALLLAGRTADHLVENAFTTVAAYGSFLVAEQLHLSGVLATLVAGLIVGNAGLLVISVRGRDTVQSFWEYAAFVANSFVFLLIGMHEARQDFVTARSAVLPAIALVTLGRAVAVYPCCLVFARSAQRVSLRHQHVLFWGGLRGALALALALALPAGLPQREAIVTVCFAVVAFSIVVQGLTLAPLLRRFGEIPART